VFQFLDVPLVPSHLIVAVGADEEHGKLNGNEMASNKMPSWDVSFLRF
jgi:hypothetical protein